MCFLQVLFECCKRIGIELGQVGYQALASGCQQHRDGLQLLDKMKVLLLDQGYFRRELGGHLPFLGSVAPPLGFVLPSPPGFIEIMTKFCA